MLVYFAGGLGVGRCKVRNREAVIEVNLKAIEGTAIVTNNRIF